MADIINVKTFCVEDLLHRTVHISKYADLDKTQVITVAVDVRSGEVFPLRVYYLPQEEPVPIVRFPFCPRCGNKVCKKCGLCKPCGDCRCAPDAQSNPRGEVGLYNTTS